MKRFADLVKESMHGEETTFQCEFEVQSGNVLEGLVIFMTSIVLISVCHNLTMKTGLKYDLVVCYLKPVVRLTGTSLNSIPIYAATVHLNGLSLTLVRCHIGGGAFHPL
ncbi:uncharacterized protein LOC121418024 [Lytechinus variegatus]|uniref:uncharacterized protein LOC121418024 n=1 Tax=Lytechinus variegatus TaxID=7654 RepID=UPI001BB284C9|nr:uncharacterized protein LOC121418024 [Lytechinus variegatus]